MNAIYLISWVAGLAAMWFLWVFGVKRLLLDLFRERIFELRFKLFRLGVSGKVPFDSDAYRTLEVMICAILRFAERITFLTYIFSKIEQDKISLEKDYEDVSKQLALKISRLDTTSQQELFGIVRGLHIAIVQYMAFTSLFFIIVAFAFTVAHFLGAWTPDKASQELGGVIEREAYRAAMRPKYGMGPVRPLHA